MSFFAEMAAAPWSFHDHVQGSEQPYVSFFHNGFLHGLQGLLRWTLADSVLDIFTADGTHAYRFNEVIWSLDGETILSVGAGLPGHGAVLHRGASLPCPGRPALQLRQRAGAAKRRNLLVLRANEESLHKLWWTNGGDDHRDWDFCISFYGQGENFGVDAFAEYQVIQSANRKYHALGDLFYDQSPFWAYDYIAFPDDDLLTTCSDVNRMFDYARRYDLLLSQPALSGHVTHPITREHPDFKLRFTSFVEPIAPWFSRDALRACVATFKGTLSAYGLDHVWPKLLGEPQNRVAIVDDVVVEHTRPVAQSYEMEAALSEGWQFQMRYGAYPTEVDYGGIFRQPIDRYHKW